MIKSTELYLNLLGNISVVDGAGSGTYVGGRICAKALELALRGGRLDDVEALRAAVAQPLTATLAAARGLQ